MLSALKSKATGEKIKAALSNIQAETGGDPDMMQLEMSTKMLPLLMEEVGGQLQKYDINSSNVVAAFMQVQQLALNNPGLKDKLSKVLSYVQGMLTH